MKKKNIYIKLLSHRFRHFLNLAHNLLTILTFIVAFVSCFILFIIIIIIITINFFATHYDIELAFGCFVFSLS